MTSFRQHCDLVLVIGYFRSALPMLAIIRHLSPLLRIGVCFQALSAQMDDKTGDAQKLFEELCRQYGATICDSGAITRCRLMLVQQYPYADDFVASVRADIKADKVWGMLTLAVMGIEAQDAFIAQFDVTRLTVPDKGLADYLIAARGAQARYAGIEMVEVGLPFRKYPVFPDFSADWIVAAPTLFSFHTEAGKQRFLRDVLKLMAQMCTTDVVAYKPHNGNAKDYFTPPLYAGIARVIGWVPKMESLLELVARRFPPGLGAHISPILTALLHAQVTRRAVPMISLTPLADMSLEAFLPGVRKGVIGGLSNTIWGASFFGLPYYNCVAPEERAGGESKLLKKSAASLLDLNISYFGVPYCYGLIDKGATNAKVAFDPVRHRSLVDAVEVACTT